MQAYLMSAESIAEQIEIISANVCPMAEDPAMCDTLLRENWEAIGNILQSIILKNQVYSKNRARVLERAISQRDSD